MSDAFTKSYQPKFGMGSQSSHGTLGAQPAVDSHQESADDIYQEFADNASQSAQARDVQRIGKAAVADALAEPAKPIGRERPTDMLALAETLKGILNGVASRCGETFADVNADHQILQRQFAEKFNIAQDAISELIRFADGHRQYADKLRADLRKIAE